MEPAEIITYVAAGLIVFFLLLSILSDWDIGEGAREVQEMMAPPPQQFKSVDAVGFLREADRFWRETCRHNESNTTHAVHVQGAGLYTKREFFDLVKRAQWCDSFQSATFGCGERENVNMPDLQLPTVATLNCTDQVLRIS